MKSAKKLSKPDQFVADMIRCRGMGFVRLGMKVEVSGEVGTIQGMNSSANLDVKFSNQLKLGRHNHNCHPTWNICYFDEHNNILADYRCNTPLKTG